MHPSPMIPNLHHLSLDYAVFGASLETSSHDAHRFMHVVVLESTPHNHNEFMNNVSLLIFTKVQQKKQEKKNGLQLNAFFACALWDDAR